MKFVPRSLIWRFVPLTLLVHLLFFGMLGSIAYQDLQRMVGSLLRQRIDTLKVELDAALTAPLLERDYVTLGEIAQELVVQQEIDYLVVFDRGGREMMRAGLAKQTELPAPRPVESVLRADKLSLAIPLFQGQARIGLDLGNVRQDFMQYAYRTIALTALTAFLASLAMLLLMLPAARRLRALETASRRFAAGEYDLRLPTGERGDEISRLGAAFNHMAAQIAQHVAELMRAEAKVQDSLAEVRAEHARLEVLLAHLRIGILFLSPNEEVIYANAALKRLWLIPAEYEPVGRPAREALAASQSVLAQPDHFSRIVLHTPGTQQISDSTELVFADGRVITQICYPVRDRDDRLLGRLWLYEDITDERRNAERLIYLAERDGLTGLYNRRLFEELLEKALLEAQRGGRHLALLLFDIDEFKYLNDYYGHRAGDAALTRIASELTFVLRRNEIFARIGGDEFAILVKDVVDERGIQKLAARVVEAVARLPLVFDGQILRLTASLGVALYPQHGITQSELIVNADIAMYQAKEHGKNGWVLYDGTLDKPSVERLSWNHRIERAIEQNGFVLHYQGIHRPDGSPLHYEALLRMRDPSNGQLYMPGSFIGLAEKSGKIVTIDRWVLCQVIDTLAAQPEIPALAVNLSGRTIADPGLPEFIAEKLRAHGVAPQRLLLEITETAAIGDIQDALRLKEGLRSLGCRLCLDDFGVGFSSFSYLKHIEPDVIKIDGLFVRRIVADRANQEVVRAIASVASSLNIMTVAEYVEDEPTCGLLTRLGVDAMQGYYFSRPQEVPWRFVP